MSPTRDIPFSGRSVQISEESLPRHPVEYHQEGRPPDIQPRADMGQLDWSTRNATVGMPSAEATQQFFASLRPLPPVSAFPRLVRSQAQYFHPQQ